MIAKSEKILVIEPSGNLYGSEMVLLEILENIDLNRFKFHVALPKGSLLKDRLSQSKTSVSEILTRKKGVSKLIAYIRLLILVWNVKPKLIFVNQAGIQKISSLIAWLMRIPIVSEVSTLEDGVHISKLNPFFFKPVKSFICNSEFINESVNLPACKKSIIYPYPSPKGFKADIPSRLEPFEIVLLGRISESKGHFLLLDALKYLKDDVPDFMFNVSFIGSASNPEVQELFEHRINLYGLENDVVLRNFQTNVQEELKNKHLMVVPSLKEPFGRIFWEAIEANLPLLVSNSGGLGELVQRFGVGETFEVNNAKSLALKMVEIYHNYEEVKKLFCSKASLAISRMNMQSYIEQIQYVFVEAMQGKDVSVTWLGNHG